MIARSQMLEIRIERRGPGHDLVDGRSQELGPLRRRRRCRRCVVAMCRPVLCAMETAHRARRARSSWPRALVSVEALADRIGEHILAPLATALKAPCAIGGPRDPSSGSRALRKHVALVRGPVVGREPKQARLPREHRIGGMSASNQQGRGTGSAGVAPPSPIGSCLRVTSMTGLRMMPAHSSYVAETGVWTAAFIKSTSVPPCSSACRIASACGRRCRGSPQRAWYNEVVARDAGFTTLSLWTRSVADVGGANNGVWSPLTICGVGWYRPASIPPPCHRR